MAKSRKPERLNHLVWIVVFQRNLPRKQNAFVPQFLSVLLHFIDVDLLTYFEAKLQGELVDTVNSRSMADW